MAVLARAEPVESGRRRVVPANVGGRRRVVMAAVDPLAARNLDLTEMMKVREGFEIGVRDLLSREMVRSLTGNKLCNLTNLHQLFVRSCDPLKMFSRHQQPP